MNLHKNSQLIDNEMNRKYTKGKANNFPKLCPSSLTFLV